MVYFTIHSVPNRVSASQTDPGSLPQKTSLPLHVLSLTSCFLYHSVFAHTLREALSSLSIELYNPKAFFIHAAWLGQSFLHCPIFLAAASRRSLDRVSVPAWLIVLSDQLWIIALVGRYPTNKLIQRGHIHHR